MNPRRADTAPAPSAPPKPTAKAPEPSPASPPPVAAPAPTESSDVNSFTKVAEITRKLYRQTNSNAVMSTAVNEIGAQWKLSRCVVAMRKPGMTPSAVKEFVAENTTHGEAKALNQLVTFVQDVVISLGTLFDQPTQLPLPNLKEIREVVSQLGIGSLLALPLSDGRR